MKAFFLFVASLLFGFGLKAQDTITPKTLLWKIQDPAMDAPSYLYGTMHSADDSVYRLIDSVLPAFKSTQTFAMEVDMDSVNPTDMVREMQLDDNVSLKDLLSKKEYKLVSKYFRKSTGYPLLLFNKVKPLYIWLIMSEGKPEKNAGDALDLYFFNLAKKQNKEVYGLEKVEDQLSLLRSISIDKQVEMLVDGVKTIETGDTTSDADLYQSYLNADLDKILSVTKMDTSMGANFMEDFIIKRNHVMASGIERLMQQGSVFAAVGAAHLPGEEGVISLLRKDGYNVSPVLSVTKLDAERVRSELK